MYINFSNPYYLWFLFSIPILIISHFYFLKRSKSKAMNFANFETLKRISGEKILTTNMTHLVLRSLTILFLVLAASGATLYYKGMVSDNSVVFTLDASPSMTTQDLDPSRFEAGKRFITESVNNMDARIKLGLISYGGVTIIHQTLTDSKLEFALALEETSIIRAGGTDISGAVVNAVNLLKLEDEGGKTIVLISDGVATATAFIGDPLQEAIRYAQDNQVIIHTVGVGTAAAPVGFLPEYYNISSWYKEGVLIDLSSATGGTFINGTDNPEAHIEVLLGELREAYIPVNIGFLALSLALIMIFLEWGLANSIYRRVA